jgi:hypothetical protein
MYSKLGDAEFKFLMVQMHQLPDSFEAHAIHEAQEEARKRGYTINDVLKELGAAERACRIQDALHDVKRKRRRENFYVIYGKILGAISLPMSLTIGFLSIRQGHLGGAVASLIWLVGSLWLLLQKMPK